MTNQDLERPQDALREPNAEDHISNDVAFWLGANFVSPAYGVKWVIQKFTGVDILEWVASQVAGDWQAVKRASIAVQNLAEFNSAFSQSIKTDWNKRLDQSWDGNAAESAKQYFDKLAWALDGQVGQLKGIAQELNNLADAMADLCRGLGDLLQEIIDLAVVALAMSWTAPENPALWAVVVRMLVKVNQAFSWLGLAWTTFTTGSAAIRSLNADTDPSAFPELGVVVSRTEDSKRYGTPIEAYDHPGA
ncbi:hypothetical protein AB0H49_02925 [Nocardia sp. NPDC050713]|uniref:hypothetical protein n=1 Tax=Nocardia sp. NPDC050713 TaxID=3154511 RepID=UPI0033DFE76F